MASTLADNKAPWREGDSCLAPSPRDGTLREATIQRLIPTSTDNVGAALLVFTNHGDGADEEKEEETLIPIAKLQRPGFSDFSQEKPLFRSSLGHLGACMPMVLSRSGADMDKVPYTINRYLRDYQREGIRFIYDNYTRSRGCILGDDMGLGKTVQVIGFLAAVLHKTGTWEDVENNRPHFLLTQVLPEQTKPNKVFLIVAPLSVLYNWKDELDTWGHFQCVVVHGLRKEEELARIKKGRSEIALTTYETLRLCLNQFNSIDWSAVIVDEAHKIKNPNSQITQAMKELKCQVRIGLTGTILQNNLEELWCVMDWAIPGCLGSLGHFKNKFSDPIEQGQRHNATKRALATGRKTTQTLAREISRWFLRRTKALIKEQLPKKNDRVVYCSLTDFQQTVYQTVLDSDDVKLLLRSSEKCDCQSGQTRRNCCYKTSSEGVKIKELYFSYLAILRKVANHVALLQPSPGTSKKQRMYVSTICERVFQKFPEFVKRCKDEAFEAMSDPIYSGKMKVLEKLLKYYMPKKDKVLLFSLSTKLLDVLESYCMAEGLDYSRLDGTTKSKDRVKIVKEFNSCPHINLCLVSTMAGGLGLNFVGANVVVLFDPTWNPANDLQAIDRAYRIGQCRDVTVLRLISLGTVEEVIYLRQVYKQQLQSSVVERESARRYFEAVQGADGQKGELFGIKNLFRLQTQGTCLTRKILEREGQVEAGVTTTSTHTGQEEEEEQERKRVSSLSESPPDSPPRPANVRVELAAPGRTESHSVDHPVTFTNQTVHHTAHTIFMIGQTPQAIRRQQLEEMAAQFKFSSVHHFVGEVLKSSSTQRQAWLRQFYTALNLPKLAEMVTHNFPQPDSAHPGPEKITHPPSSSTTTPSSSSKPKARARTKRTSRKAGLESPSNARTPNTSAPGPRKKPGHPHRNAPEPLSDVLLPESEEQEETVYDARGHKRTKRRCVSSSGASRVGAGLGSDQAGNRTLGPGQAAAFLDHRDRDTPSSLPFSHSLSKTPSKPTTQAMEEELKSSHNTCKNIEEQIDNLRPSPPPPPEEAPSNASHHSLLTDLIGDTSILDDLFRPKPRGSTKTPPTSTSAVTQASPQRSKCSRKDFWDILNEGNEESINRLTDISEVERVCINAGLTARTRARGEERESAVLWKTNEKFLWKK
ncbi:DNA excision repair protein ERCC-6-like 2 [Lampris incognitus]|uniref:DNA excision repair protein ERCC-6-like 2 n=1 Tax=Lampris incognitus TaxID=2546036 RepID=UPI0024B51A37|nr:DNA excision repair protein ERCC-6-like 2 [Lampris incognitus]